ncbi:MAG TPA: hypothetical protein VFD50_08210 [Thermoleophilia bacterium]|nr:hypothetical protein [Thermoleophilia bacterium]
MTATSRALALVVGFVGLILAVAAFVRELSLAAHSGLSWPVAFWWDRLITAEPRLGASIAAGVAGVVAIVLLVLAFRQLGSERRRTTQVEFGAGEGSTRLEVQALELALRHDIERTCPGVRTQSLTLSKRGDAWRVRLEALMPAADLAGVRLRMAGLVAEDLWRAGGMRLDGLDVVVKGLEPAPGAR